LQGLRHHASFCSRIKKEEEESAETKGQKTIDLRR